MNQKRDRRVQRTYVSPQPLRPLESCLLVNYRRWRQQPSFPLCWHRIPLSLGGGLLSVLFIKGNSSWQASGCFLWLLMVVAGSLAARGCRNPNHSARFRWWIFREGEGKKRRRTFCTIGVVQKLLHIAVEVFQSKPTHRVLWKRHGDYSTYGD